MEVYEATEDTTMLSDTAPCPVSRSSALGERTTALPALWLRVDGVLPLLKPAMVVQTAVQLGDPESVPGPWGSWCSPGQGSLCTRTPLHAAFPS